MSDTNIDSDTTAPLPVVEIHADLRGELDARVQKANRRLSRAGASDCFTYTVEEFIREEYDSTAKRTEYIPMIRVTLSAPQITAPGYTFLAALTREEAGMVVRTAPGQNLDGWDRPEEHHCDYCGTSRTRSTSYVVRNDTTGEALQIGKSCLTPFLGVAPAGLWALQFDPEDFVPTAPTGSRSEKLYPIRDLLALAWVITGEGRHYVSRTTAATNDSLTPTSIETLYVYDWQPLGTRDWREEQRIKDLRTAAAAVETATIDELLAEADALDPDSDFGANVQIAVSSNLISRRSIGFLVSLIAVRNRRLRDAVAEQERAAERDATVDGWLGAETDTLTDFDVTIRTVFEVDGYAYNSTDSIIIMRADSGHILKWKTSGAHPEITQGSRWHIRRCRVKKQGEYKGTKQTVVKLVKMDPITAETHTEGLSQ